MRNTPQQHLCYRQDLSLPFLNNKSIPKPTFFAIDKGLQNSYGRPRRLGARLRGRRVVQQHTLLARVLRTGFSEGLGRRVLRRVGVLQWLLEGKGVLRRILRVLPEGAQKAETRPFVEYNSLPQILSITTPRAKVGLWDPKLPGRTFARNCWLAPTTSSRGCV